jgi:large subunit ribosomal protein L9
MNYLLPRQEILIYNAKNFLWLEKQQLQQEQEHSLLEEKAHQLYQKINNFTLNFTLNKNEKGEPFGSVSFKEILTELEKSDFHLNKGQLLDFRSLNKLGENIVPVKLSSNLIANLKVIVS